MTEGHAASQKAQFDAPDEAMRVAEAAEASSPLGIVDELRARLESALKRVEALEERLDEQEKKRQVEALQAKLGNGQHQTMEDSKEEFRSWEPSICFPGSMGSPTAVVNTPVYVNKSFSFEAFRRANSSRLQSERLRVLVPPDHHPMWPLFKK